MPGRLSVSRAFGDCMAKLEQYGGNPDCVIATPEIESFPLVSEVDYIMLGSDGVFDRLDNT
jgi:protein phosphatase PTC2/3